MKNFLCTVALLFAAAAVFGQASTLRDYVGIIDGSYHPDALAYFDKMKEDYKKRGKNDVVKAIDDYIKMGFGSGFVYVAPDGVNYVITNYHVVAQTNALSISFERLDGAKMTYDRLRVIAADEDIDMAILAFADGARPFTSGLTFVKTPAEEGADVFAAGFPGLGVEQIWQFSKGVISNARVRLPRDPEEDIGVNEARFGPFIQHTSAIDPGNSGGPLLVAQAGVTSGYAVAGINSIGFPSRAATFWAIPADRALAYITEAIQPINEAARRHNLDLRLDAFIKSLTKPKAVYTGIADFLSNGCAASNAEYAIMETSSRAPYAVKDAIDKVRDPVDAMKYCVAWLVEDSFRDKTTGTLRATLGNITQNIDGSYTAPLNFSDGRVINTTWVTEFGIWKLDKAGDLVSGDKTLVAKKEEQQKKAKRARSFNDFVMLSAGYTTIFDHWAGDDPYVAPAVDASLLIVSYKYWLSRISLTFAEGLFWQLDLSSGYTVPITIKAVTIAPYATIGFNIHRYNTSRSVLADLALGIEFGAILQGGLMLTTAWVPGLYVAPSYQYNLSFIDLLEGTTPPDEHMLKINIGYAFSF